MRPGAVLLQGDARSLPLADASVQCVVTSPPYWGLRDYGLASTVWDGESGHVHKWGAESVVTTGRNDEGAADIARRAAAYGTGCRKALTAANPRTSTTGAWCHCGAWRGVLGLEPTPELYVAHLVEIFREVRRVLREDGTCWLNLGDSYASSPPGRGPQPGVSGLSGILSLRYQRTLDAGHNTHQGTLDGARAIGLKPKDLVGIPWLVAKALQAPYYTGRIKDEGDRRWLAAMIDGEGTICGFHHIREDDGRPRTGVHVFITNGSTALLDEAYRIWPTSRSEHQRPGSGHLGTMTTYRWIVHGIGNKALFLRELYPYLITKKRQAVVAYNLLLLMADAKRLGHTPQRDAVRERRKTLTDLLSSLNQGRPVDLPNWLLEPPSVLEPGWWLRSDIIWAKRNCMPESVEDRPTRAHEYLFLLTKSARYFYNALAIAEPIAEATLADRVDTGRFAPDRGFPGPRDHGNGRLGSAATRNRRSVWTIATEPYPEAHFATFPEKLVEPCVLAGTSERGACPTCGAGWIRETSVEYDNPTNTTTNGPRSIANRHQTAGFPVRLEKRTSTIGWSPSCDHSFNRRPIEPVPCRVLDPFAGSGTTVAVAERLGRVGIGVELKADYLTLARQRTAQAGLL